MRKATKVGETAADAPMTPEQKAAATTRTPEQQARIDAEKEALARVDAETAAGTEGGPAPAMSPLDVLKAQTLDRDPTMNDAPKRPARAPQFGSSHLIESGDKVDNLATKFHQAIEEEGFDDTLSRRARARAGMPMSEEDRRRAILDEQQGVDTFAREGQQNRPNEPTLQECNAQFFREEDDKMARKVALQESVGEVLHDAFGPQGARRAMKNLR